ncbi:hypothetical protein Tco_0343358 [Tanacetum coccineum]
MIKNMRKSFVHKNNVKELLKKINEAFIDVVPKLVTKATDQNRQDNLLWLEPRAELSSKVTNDLVTNVPQQVDTFLRNYMNTNILHVHPTSLSSSIPDLHYHLYTTDNSSQTISSTQQRNKEYDPWSRDQETNGDEVPSEEASPVFLVKISRSDTNYQLKVNLTSPTLTVPCIEDLSPSSIISIPFVGLIYENSKKERRVMNTDEILKFCDATLERVLKNVKKISLDVKHSFKDPPFNKEDANLMRFFSE